jgi:aspartate/methionine/tyrosine aminotransferase
MKLASRLDHIEPFYVMECAKAAAALARSPACADSPMIFLNIGEPDFTAPAAVQDAASRAIRNGCTQYTDALGLPALRERISQWYAERFGLDVAPRRIVVTAGASAALQLACLALVDQGDEVLLPDPSYPCNRHFVAAAQGVPVLLPASAEQRYQLSAAGVEDAWGAKTRGVLLASPSNPTGTSIDPVEMSRIVSAVRARGGFTLVDEIYLGLSFDERYGHSALRHGDDVLSINSFSKYFCMTGWRL